MNPGIDLSGLSYFKSTKVKRGRIDIWIRSAEWLGISLIRSNPYITCVQYCTDVVPLIRHSLRLTMAVIWV